MGYSINMLSSLLTEEGRMATVTIRRVSLEEAWQLVAEPFVSAVGHEGTAQLLTDLLGVIPIQLKEGDKLLVALPQGRLPEGKVLKGIPDHLYLVLVVAE